MLDPLRCDVEAIEYDTVGISMILQEAELHTQCDLLPSSLLNDASAYIRPFLGRGDPHIPIRRRVLDSGGLEISSPASSSDFVSSC
jgi:hypothetical protein